MACFSTRVSHAAKRLSVLAILLFQMGCQPGYHFWTNWWTPGDTVDNVGYHPEQPIDFPHDLHAGEKQIPCQYCHSAARRSSWAGIPSMNVCMGCHNYVATDKEPIKYLTDKYQKKEPIVWTKVHDMPDFVRFAHKPHVLSDKLAKNYEKEFAENDGEACFLCHGNVKEMGTVSQAKSLQMGWCIDCHVTNEAPVSCETCHY
ncbi:cytochrome c3 family protein [Pseudobacteriovorax antillogorgiicola]|uniref:Quinol:cytochrome c oxidoreductase pentaheme cytochrome subunit n=1 Tax=Pseudobacteriovorax antillogorgiicola TaxID=1513793 RepID=A0A1Y6C453_9BACT|nr:cytochrome c3 family protein [Pseudobacteriovorax antillogorgiicola]TCS50256.1 quinol:cytochrome c oxidoreductase pentaheme cytochrome subunit [Pseudobacteriovorax antillogorgiicola]SMF32989.1 quinol:cytochrome c oxidoreductase pentaheme cytochrome subunit [Pseudobacteriovorax antillogorgiicola]